MFIQLAIGSALMLTTIVIAGASFWLMEWAFVYLQGWLNTKPHRPKLIAALCVATVWVLVQFTAGVWLWAFVFFGLDIFSTLEAAVYFSLVAFTTLGFGDLLLPMEWRLLSGMAAANGLLNIGLVAAILVEALRHVRQQQIAAMKDTQ